MTQTSLKDVFLRIGSHDVHVMCAGSGENVVFLHGWGSSCSAFLFAANELSKRFKVILTDFAGFGQSGPPDFAYSVPDYAAETLAALEALGVERAHFVGHSFGGRVSLEIASKYPSRVASLSLVDSAGLKPRRGLEYYAKVYLHKLLKKLGFKGLAGSSDYRELSPLMKETFKKIVNYDQTSLLSHISCPTAIFWGKEDCETPLYMARAFNKGIADSALFMLDGGHFAFVEDRAKFLAILNAFLTGQEGK